MKLNKNNYVEIPTYHKQAGNILLTTATALEDKSSCGDMAVKYAIFVNVYTNVTNGMEMNMARGRFLVRKPGRVT